MHPNENLLERFYTSFGKRDFADMNSCYAPDAEFSDPVFALRGKRVGAMWHMLCESGKDLRITFRDLRADDTSGSVHWEAYYTFSMTGRSVHNVVEGTFVFRDGKILRHSDRFDFWKWSRMALGFSGVLLGWSSLLRRQVQKRADANLQRFLSAHPEYASVKQRQ